MYDDIQKNADESLTDGNLKKLTTGAVLLARDILKDPNFDSTIVLVCVYSSEGSYGLVLNRPAHMPLSEIFEGFENSTIKREVFVGGPVRQEEIQVLQLTDEPIEGAFRISSRVFLGGDWDGIGHMIEADPATTRLFLGYSGWGPGQLESEISAGAWDVFNVDIEKLLKEDVAKLMSDPKQLGQYLQTLQVTTF